MISKMTQALILSGCLLAAGTASADGRDAIVPALAGAAVGAVLATVIAKADDDRDHHRRDYRPHPRYRPAAYAPPPVVYRRVAPPPRYVPAPRYVEVRRVDDRYHGHRRDGRW